MKLTLAILTSLYVILAAGSSTKQAEAMDLNGLKAPILTVSPTDDPRPIFHLAATKKKKGKACPDGLTRDSKTGKCFNPCSHNDHWENGTCVPCKPGSHEETQADDNGDEQNVCVENVKKKQGQSKKCPQGTELKNGKCRKTEFPPIEQCPEGQNPDPVTGVCFSCSHNDHFENGTCVPCKRGFHVEGDACVAD